VFAGGSVVQWLRDGLGLIKKSAESERIAKSVPDTGGVYFVPAFTGLGAPHWDADARGLISGITRGSTKAHIVRAGLEAIAFQVFDVLHAAERDTGLKLASLKVDGGAAANDFLMQFQADICGIKIMRPAFLEVTALGAAYLAGLHTGFFKSVDELKSRVSCGVKEFIPALSEVKRNMSLIGWEEAVLRAKVR
jgi:glycerol kinase